MESIFSPAAKNTQRALFFKGCSELKLKHYTNKQCRGTLKVILLENSGNLVALLPKENPFSTRST
jgi:hypothetical protein